MARLVAAPLLAVLGALVSTGCNGLQIHSTTLPPSTVTSHVATDADEEDFSCFPFLCTCLCHLQVACGNFVTGSGQVQVGDQRFWDFGTPPCNCEWYRNCVSRGWIVFDTSPLTGKGIVTARLRWQARGQHVRSLWQGGDPPSGHGSSPWHFAPAVPDIELLDFPPGGSGAGAHDVSIVVRDWVTGVEPNRGFFLVGPNEAFDEFGNLTRVSTASGFTLDVEFTD